MQDPKQALSIEWLRDTLVTLLSLAQLQDPPDHQACAKYADLLYKMLPRQSNEKGALAPDELARARQAVLDELARQSAHKPTEPQDPD